MSLQDVTSPYGAHPQSERRDHVSGEERGRDHAEHHARRAASDDVPTTHRRCPENLRLITVHPHQHRVVALSVSPDALGAREGGGRAARDEGVLGLTLRASAPKGAAARYPFGRRRAHITQQSREYPAAQRRPRRPNAIRLRSSRSSRTATASQGRRPVTCRGSVAPGGRRASARDPDVAAIVHFEHAVVVAGGEAQQRRGTGPREWECTVDPHLERRASERHRHPRSRVVALRTSRCRGRPTIRFRSKPTRSRTGVGPPRARP